MPLNRKTLIQSTFPFPIKGSPWPNSWIKWSCNYCSILKAVKTSWLHTVQSLARLLFQYGELGSDCAVSNIRPVNRSFLQLETELWRTQRIAKDRSARREPSKSGSDRLKLNPHTTFFVEVEGVIDFQMVTHPDINLVQQSLTVSLRSSNPFWTTAPISLKLFMWFTL